MNRRRVVASVDALESRRLLSAVVAKPAAEVHVAVAKSFVLNGSFAGVFTTIDTGGSLFTGGGSISRSAVPVALEGMLTGSVNPRVFLFTGTFTLSNSLGSVTLSLSAHHPKVQTSFLPPAKAVITGATGAFAGYHGWGTVNIHITPNINGLGGPFKASMRLTVRK